MALLKPGVPTAMFGLIDQEFRLRGRIALTPLADAIVRQAKINASNGRHAYGTPTPARPGLGPATISRTLVNSLDRSTVERQPFGWFVQVGTAINRYPQTYKSKKPSSKYGYILEVTGLKNGNKYPFLYPAFKWGVDHVATVIYTEKYGTGWSRLI